MAYQNLRVVTQENSLVSKGQISVDERFETPKKLRAEPELKDLPTTAMKSFNEDNSQNANYTYNVQEINDDKKTGCGGYCNGE